MLIKWLIKFYVNSISGLSSSQIVGHISYVQIRDHLLPYKEVIGQVMLNFSPRTKLVVTKTNTIDNKFRNLDLEILAGDPSLGFDVTVKENTCSFKLDFSKVYWNPRLSTEHERIVDLVKRGDIVFDVFAGVGPFAIPLGNIRIDQRFSFFFTGRGSILNKHFRWQFWCVILGSVVCAVVGILWVQLGCLESQNDNRLFHCNLIFRQERPSDKEESNSYHSLC